jgi:NACalpha-BTF3-like transcription factor
MVKTEQRAPIETADEKAAKTNDVVTIELVMDQAHCTWDAAVLALANNNGDVVYAIMELTS